MTISRCTEVVSAVVSMHLPFFAFRFAFECFELVAPQLVKELPQGDEPLRSRSVEPPSAVASLAHESRLLEDGQVLRDRRPGDVEVRRDLTGSNLTVTDESEDGSASGGGNGLESGVHRQSVTDYLRKSQLK